MKFRIHKRLRKPKGLHSKEVNIMFYEKLRLSAKYTTESRPVRMLFHSKINLMRLKSEKIQNLEEKK